MIRCQELRLDCDKKQEEIANFLGVKRNTYSKWENCINDIPLEIGNELANYYNVSYDYLLGISNIKNYKNSKQTIDTKKLANRLLEERKNRKLSQEVLSKKIGFSQRSYSYYENGTRIPTVFKVLIIAQYYNISVDYFIGRIDNKVNIEQ